MLTKAGDEDGCGKGGAMTDRKAAHVVIGQAASTTTPQARRFVTPLPLAAAGDETPWIP